MEDLLGTDAGITARPQGCPLHTRKCDPCGENSPRALHKLAQPLWGWSCLLLWVLPSQLPRQPPYQEANQKGCLAGSTSFLNTGMAGLHGLLTSVRCSKSQACAPITCWCMAPDTSHGHRTTTLSGGCSRCTVALGFTPTPSTHFLPCFSALSKQSTPLFLW
jgi:hypothetical protein